MKMYNATVEVAVKNATAEQYADDLMGALATYSVAVGTSARGWLEVRLSVPAESLLQATTTALSVVETAAGAGAIACEVMTEDEFAAREGFTTEPDIVSTEDAAALLGVSAERVRQHLRAGRLQEVPTSGRGKVFTRSSVLALRDQHRAPGRPRKVEA